jgi:hypothetical protein
MIRTEVFDPIRNSRAKSMLVAGILAGGMVVSPLFGQSSSPAATPNQAPAAASSTAPIAYRTGLPSTAAAPAPAPRYHPNRFAGKAGHYYELFWGVQSLTVKAAESGELIRFSYNVVDPLKAKTLNEKKNDAYLVFPDAGIRLSVPSLEKVGQLRQSPDPEAGKSYWMAFSNPGRRVKRGDHVNVMIGNFHAENLVVE